MSKEEVTIDSFERFCGRVPLKLKAIGFSLD
jgi:hypothetical protein